MKKKYYLDAFLEVKELTKEEFDHCMACCLQDREEFELVIEDDKKTIVIKRQLVGGNGK